MHKLNFFPLGNADCCRIDLSNGNKILFDFAATRGADNGDRRIDLPTVLRQDLHYHRRSHYEVVAFTHLDDDHICGSTEFFHLQHDRRYQGEGRIHIGELWVPAAVITEDRPGGEASVIQKEARYRLLQGHGIRVFSRPGRLQAWLARNGVSLEARRNLITDAGQVVPGFTLDAHGVEFFVHSPFARRMNDGGLEDRNQDSLVMQATFRAGTRHTRLILGADATHNILTDIVQITRQHKREERLAWDVFKLPHHCSYLSLAPDKGVEKTQPVPEVRWLFENQGAHGAIIVSTSDAIPSEDSDLPPHRQAAAYYRQDVIRPKLGEFKVTMEHPTRTKPGPLVVHVDALGARVEKSGGGGAGGVVGTVPPRAGRD